MTLRMDIHSEREPILSAPVIDAAPERTPSTGQSRRFENVHGNLLAMRYGPRAGCLFPPAERRRMSVTPTIKSTRPPKKTYRESRKAHDQLFKRLNNSLGEYGNE